MVSCVCISDSITVILGRSAIVYCMRTQLQRFVLTSRLFSLYRLSPDERNVQFWQAAQQDAHPVCSLPQVRVPHSEEGLCQLFLPCG